MKSIDMKPSEHWAISRWDYEDEKVKMRYEDWTSQELISSISEETAFSFKLMEDCMDKLRKKINAKIYELERRYRTTNKGDQQ